MTDVELESTVTIPPQEPKVNYQNTIITTHYEANLKYCIGIQRLFCIINYMSQSQALPLAHTFQFKHVQDGESGNEATTVPVSCSSY